VSTLKVNAITDASGGNTATINSMTPTADSLQGFRNRIINGDMRIDQRNAGASVTATATTFIVDRFGCYTTQSSKYTGQQNAGSVTPPVGFTKYLGVTSSSAYSVISSDYFGVLHRIEGQNVADLEWGTANAKTVTLSFWVRSSLTGTFGGSISNSAYNRVYPFSYSVSSANTWTSISVTIPGDTSGTWLTTNGIGMEIVFGLGAGSTYSGTSGAWAAGWVNQPTSTVSVVGTNGATWYITGVQLEVGSVATPFERRDYGRELILCQRYYENTSNLNTKLIWTGDATTGNNYYATGLFAVAKRASPTFTGTITAGTGFSGGAPADSDAFINGWNIAAACTSTGARRYYTFGFTASAEL
jgi:hypothetical protein